MKISHYAVKHPVVIAMFLIALLVFGIYCIVGLGMEFIPDMSLPEVEIITIYPGASAEDVENDITKIIEEDLVTLPYFKSMSSQSNSSFSWITVIYQDGIDVYEQLTELRFRLQMLEDDLPADAHAPYALVGGATMLPVMQFAITGGEDTSRITSYINDTLKPKIISKVIEISKKVALALQVKGLMNLQLAVKDDDIWMIEANPRASRTVPFISKATGIPLAKIGTQIMLGKTLKELGIDTDYRTIDHYAIKASVFPFLKLPGVDSILTPEMKSTGEVMGIDEDFDIACYKAYVAAGNKLPKEGGVYVTVNDADKPRILESVKELYEMGFNIYATKGTSTFLRTHGIQTTTVFTLSDKYRPQAVEYMREGMINMIINTPSNKSGAIRDGYTLRRLAVELEIPFLTTANGANTAVAAIKVARGRELGVRSMREYHTFND